MSETDCGPECAEILREIETYVDNELDAARLAKIQEHLDGCSPCMDRAEFRATLRDIVASKCCSEDVPASLASRIQALLDEV